MSTWAYRSIHDWSIKVLQLILGLNGACLVVLICSGVFTMYDHGLRCRRLGGTLSASSVPKWIGREFSLLSSHLILKIGQQGPSETTTTQPSSVRCKKSQYKINASKVCPLFVAVIDLGLCHFFVLNLSCYKSLVKSWICTSAHCEPFAHVWR
jgi:hypothetical protein